jgi:hypothetical protein
MSEGDQIKHSRAMAQAVSRRPLTTEAQGSVPGQVHVRFVVDKLALGQVFLRVVGFPLSISFHWCSINRKNLVKENCSSLSSSLGLHKKP